MAHHLIYRGPTAPLPLRALRIVFIAALLALTAALAVVLVDGSSSAEPVSPGGRLAPASHFPGSHGRFVPPQVPGSDLRFEMGTSSLAGTTSP